MSDRKLSKEHRGHFAQAPRRSYSEKLKDPRWQKKRLEVFNAAGWRCQECRAADQTLNVHHSFYELGKEPWEADGALMLCLCEQHHRERQEVEQRILAGVARRLCVLNLRGLRAVAGVEGLGVAALMRVAPATGHTDAPAVASGAIAHPAAPKQMHFAVNEQQF